MHRPGWYRVVLAVWGLWFSTALIEPAGLASCAMHSAAGAKHSAAGAVHGGHGAMPMHEAPPAGRRMALGHAASSTDHPASSVANGDRSADARTLAATEQPPAHTADCCTCLGLCCASAATARPASPVSASIVAWHAPIVERGASLRRAPAPPPHTLPFANGPPAASHA